MLVFVVRVKKLENKFHMMLIGKNINDNISLKDVELLETGRRLDSFDLLVVYRRNHDSRRLTIDFI